MLTTPVKLTPRHAAVAGLALVAVAVVGTFAVQRLSSLAGTAIQSGVVGNAAPSVDAVVPSDASGSGSVALPAAGFTLNEGATRNLYIRGTVSDPNGCEDIAGVSVTAYRSGAIGGSGCTLDANDCYYAAVAKAELVGCTGAGDTDATFETSIAVANFADPTDAGSPRATDTWVALVSAADAANLGSSLSADFEIQSLAAFSVAPSLMDYGTIALGATSSQQSLTATNTGNRSVNSYVRADGDMHSSLAGFADIASTQTHYSVSQATAWADGTPITATDSDLPLALAQQVADAGPAPTAPAYFYLKLPASGIRGTYTNTLYFTAYAAGGAVAQGLSNGMAAIGEIGQYDFTNTTRPTSIFTQGANGGGTHVAGMFSVVGVLQDLPNHRLYVSDSGNHRVLVYRINDNGTVASHTPIAVLGQPNLTSAVAPAVPSATSMNGPRAMAWDATNKRLFVADSSNNRVLVFDMTNGPTTGMAAVGVIGQTAFNTAAVATSAQGLRAPNAVAYDATNQNQRLYVSDRQNNRVLIYDARPSGSGSITMCAGGASTTGLTQFNMSASCVIGQVNMNALAALNPPSATSLRAPIGIALDLDHDRLFVVDATNNRALSYDITSLSNTLAANDVFGQVNLTTFTQYSGTAVTASTLRSPSGIAWDNADERLFVTDANSHRIVVYNLNGATADGLGMAAANVLGQATLNQTILGVGVNASNLPYPIDSQHIAFPYAVAWDATNKRLYETEGTSGNRVLSFDLSSGLTDGMAADDVIGQYTNATWPFNVSTPSFTKASRNGNPWGMAAPYGVMLEGTYHRLFVADATSNRVLVYNLTTDNKLIDGQPDFVLGKPTMDVVGTELTQNGMNIPNAFAFDAARQWLFVSDSSNNRVTIYDLSSGLYDGMNAMRVIGQPDYVTGTASAAANGLNGPAALAWDAGNQRLFIGDSNNNRIQVYDLPGVPNFGANATFTVAVTDVRGLTYDSSGHRLFAASRSGNALKVYDVATMSNTPTLLRTLGTGTAGAGQNQLSGPTGLSLDAVNGRLFVHDGNNNRAVVFDVRAAASPARTWCGNTSTGIGEAMMASCVVGQDGWGSNTAGTTGTTLSTNIYNNHGISYDSVSERLYVTDSYNSRVMVFDAAVATP